jgi:hypothetical protein
MVAAAPEAVAVAFAVIVACVTLSTLRIDAATGIPAPARGRPMSCDPKAAVADVTVGEPFVVTRSVTDRGS